MNDLKHAAFEMANEFVDDARAQTGLDKSERGYAQDWKEQLNIWEDFAKAIKGEKPPEQKEKEIIEAQKGEKNKPQKLTKVRQDLSQFSAPAQTHYKYTGPDVPTSQNNTLDEVQPGPQVPQNSNTHSPDTLRQKY